MTNTQQALLNTFTAPATASSPAVSISSYRDIFEEHRHKIYSLAFWMTDNEIVAEEISSVVFGRSFSRYGATPEFVAASLDINLVAALREIMPIGNLTLNTPITSTKSITGNTKRIHLERAVVQVPPTERFAFLLHDVEGYSNQQVAGALGITEDESRNAVLQARILVRELIAQMI